MYHEPRHEKWRTGRPGPMPLLRTGRFAWPSLRTASVARGLLAAEGWTDVPSWESVVVQGGRPPDRPANGGMGGNTLRRLHGTFSSATTCCCLLCHRSKPSPATHARNNADRVSSQAPASRSRLAVAGEPRNLMHSESTHSRVRGQAFWLCGPNLLNGLGAKLLAKSYRA